MHYAGAALNHRPGDLAILGGVLLVSALVCLYLLADLRSTPSGFPWPEGEGSGTVRESTKEYPSGIIPRA